MDGPGASTKSVGRLRIALVVGAAIWLLLLVVGFFAPGGWRWGLTGPVGHIENYMICFWLAALVLAPLLAGRDPLPRRSTIQVYLLGLLGIVVSTFRGEPPTLLTDGLPIAAAAITAGLVIWAHPRRARLWRS
jgi:hypothetical protein